MNDSKTGKLWKKKKVYIPLLVILFVIGIRIVLEPVLLKVVNKEAKTINPVFEAHVGDLDLAILRGGVLLENVTAKIKKNDREFFEVKDVLVDLAWRELFKGNISFDVLVNDFNLKVKKDLLTAVKELPKKPEVPGRKEEKKELPFNIGRVNVQNSRITMLDYPGLNNQKHLTVSNIEGTISNISGKEGTKLAKYDMSASLGGKSKMNGTGNFDISADPIRWDLNGKLMGFQLPSLNKVLAAYLPANYKKGSLDVYSEVKSEGGKIYGYVKPFMNDVQMMGNKQEWKSGSHFFIELLGTVTNLVLENSDRETVATRVPFIYEDGAFSVETGDAIVDAVKHGLLESDTVPRGVEDKYRLNRANPKEVQAQEESLKEAKKEKKEKEKEEKEEKKDQ